MKLSCSRSTLLSGFQMIGSVISSRTPKEILKCAKLEVGDGKATLSGTDLEVSVRFDFEEVEVMIPGEILLSVHELVSILREATTDTIEIELKKDEQTEQDFILIQAGKSEFRLSVHDPSEFPSVETFNETNFFEIPTQSFREMIRRTVFATDPESTRYALGGVLFDVENDKLTLAATDGRRLAMVESACTYQGEEPYQNNRPVIPAKAMSLIEKSLIGDEGSIQIAIRANDVIVKSGRSTIFGRLVEGRFPKYRDVIPPEPIHSIDLEVGTFFGAVRQAQIVTDVETRGVDFVFASGLLTLKSVAASVGESKVEIPIPFEGDEIVITFDVRYLADFLKTLDSAAHIRLQLIDSDSAAVLKSDDGYTYVIMPLSQAR